MQIRFSETEILGLEDEVSRGGVCHQPGEEQAGVGSATAEHPERADEVSVAELRHRRVGPRRLVAAQERSGNGGERSGLANAIEPGGHEIAEALAQTRSLSAQQGLELVEPNLAKWSQ